MTPQLKKTLINIYRLRHALKKQMEKCKADVHNDIGKFDKSVKKHVSSGSLSQEGAGISV